MTQFGLVGVHGARGLILLNDKRIAGFFGQWGINGRQHFDDIFDVEVGREYFHFARFNFGQIQNVIDQREQVAS